MNFFKEPKKKKLQWAKELYCDATIFVIWFFIVYLPKKYGNLKMANGPTFPYLFVQAHHHKR